MRLRDADCSALKRACLAWAQKSTGREASCTDEVWILKGAKVPFLLRRERENRYRIIGEAYVHGIMYGEQDPRRYLEEYQVNPEEVRLGEGPQKISLL